MDNLTQRCGLGSPFYWKDTESPRAKMTGSGLRAGAEAGSQCGVQATDSVLHVVGAKSLEKQRGETARKQVVVGGLA